MITSDLFTLCWLTQPKGTFKWQRLYKQLVEVTELPVPRCTLPTWISPQKDQMKFYIDIHKVSVIYPPAPFSSWLTFLSPPLSLWTVRAARLRVLAGNLSGFDRAKPFFSALFEERPLIDTGSKHRPSELRGSSSTGSVGRLACIPIWSNTHIQIHPTLKHASTYVYINIRYASTQRMKMRRSPTRTTCMSSRHTCIHKSHTQEDICKKDVVTFGYVGKEIIGMMEIWAQAYAHTHTNTLTFSLGIQGRKT